jgi:M6 family metalloprotease-like protein
MVGRKPCWYLFSLALIALIVFAWPSKSPAVPAAPDISEITQPDGSAFYAKVKGDEWSNWVETLYGFSIARGSDGYWYHVLFYLMDIPVLSGFYAHEVPPVGVQAHLRPSPGVMQAPAEEEDQPISVEAAPQGTFNGKILFILAEFTDVSGTYTEANFASFISNNINDYFDEASYGAVTLSPADESYGTADNGVVGWVNVGYAHPNTGSSTGTANRQLTADAITAADPYVDFSAYDTDSDGYVDADELAVVVVAAGYERAYSASYPPNIWGHKWSLFGSVSAPTVDGVKVGDYHSGEGGYAQFGEIHRNTVSNAHQATMGIMVHELGHLVFGLPDLYDTDYSSTGIGAWGIMASGSWGRASSDSYSGETPVLPSAWTKYDRGWVSASTASGTISILAAGSGSATSVNTVYKLDTGLSNEYFLVENRQPVGYDRGLERWLGTGFGGLAIWHIDEDQTNNRNECYPPSDCTSTHYWVALEQADGNWDLEKDTNSGNATDLWYSGNAMAFDENSTPSSDLYDGTASDVRLTGIGDSGDTTTATAPGSQKEKLMVLLQGADDRYKLQILDVPSSLGGNTGPPVASDRNIGINIVDIGGGEWDGFSGDELVVMRGTPGEIRELFIYNMPQEIGGNTGSPVASDRRFGTNRDYMAVGNFDADDEHEMAVTQYFSDREIYRLFIYDPPTTRGGNTGRSIASDRNIGSNIVAIAAANFDEDSQDELVVVRRRADGIHTLQIYNVPTELGGETGPVFVSDDSIGRDIIEYGLAAGNFDDDLRPEIAIVRRRSSGRHELVIYDAPTSLGGDTGPALTTDTNIGRNIKAIASYTPPS